MSKLRLTFFGSRSAPAPQQLPPGQAGAPQNQPPQRFQLQTAQQRQPTLDWEWGEETQKLFQLQKTTTASTRELVSTHHKPTSVSSNTQHAADFERWRRPQMPTANEPTAAITETSPLVGEILPASTEPESLWAKPPQDRAQSVATMPPQPTTLHSNSSSYRRNGTVHSATNSALLQPFLGEEGMRRVLATRIALDEALDRWWTNGEHAPLALLRDGLLTLEAGHELDETQRSFLLRTALRAGRGIVTALQYQMDADRTAFLLKEALLDTKLPFDPALIGYLRQHDEQSAEWADYLEHDLAYEATVASGKRSQLAATALRMMQAQQTSAPSSGPNNTLTASPVTRPATQPKRAGVQHPIRRFTAATLKPWPMPTKTMPEPMLRPLSHRWSLRWLFWAVLVLFVALRLGWPQLISSAPMVEIPAGTYRISDSASSDPATSGRFRPVALAAYAIDRHEVTNAAYRRCWEQNACPTPHSFDSHSRPGYFVNRSFNDFPVVNIDWEAAATYCAWIGKRLPTSEEWEVAASLAPTTGLRYTYPWGERFDPRVANSALSELNDTQAVGAYHPAGSTPLGIMDMAGNVAEWTSMPAASIIDGIVVKGGSFQDAPEQLRNDALVELPRSTSAPWLGFRCAANQ